MTDLELQSRLANLRSPVSDEATASRALSRASTALSNTPRNATASHRWWIAPLTATAAASTLVALFLVGQNDDSRILSEMEQLFPRQLQAVIRQGSQTDLLLAAMPATNPDQRVRITVNDSGLTTEILTYSGQEICIALKSGPICFVPLITEHGHVLVVTNEDAFVQNGRIHAAKISASVLTRS